MECLCLRYIKCGGVGKHIRYNNSIETERTSPTKADATLEKSRLEINKLGGKHISNIIFRFFLLWVELALDCDVRRLQCY